MKRVYQKHSGRHVWFADFHHPGPRTYLRCRKCGRLYDGYKDAKEAKKRAAA